jgi:hypothetical protein
MSEMGRTQTFDRDVVNGWEADVLKAHCGNAEEGKLIVFRQTLAEAAAAALRYP